MTEIEKLYQETKDSDLVIVSVEIGEPLNVLNHLLIVTNITLRYL
ncbi:hypothetical protein [Clostridium diolis]|jgi:predicted nuclease of predicted toxin-antitoxin system|nr:hypothetical protein [Clostridium diolis]